MNTKKTFVSKGMRKLTLEEYLKSQFQSAGYSHSEIRRTPMGMRITVHADRVGLIIGRGGQTINTITYKLKNEFGLENPRLNVNEIQNPFLNASIVAEEIKNAIEKSVNHRKICNIMMKKILEAGAVGCQIRISGRFGTAKGRTDKFQQGYIKHSGNYAKELVDKATVTAQTRLSSIGIQVKIMLEKPESELAKLREIIEKKPEKAKAAALVCPHCGKTYDNERSLKIHVGQRHSGAEATVAQVAESQPAAEPKQDQTHLLQGTVDEVKKNVELASRVDFAALLKSEREGKNRKGIVDFLERKIAEKEAKE